MVAEPLLAQSHDAKVWEVLIVCTFLLLLAGCGEKPDETRMGGNYDALPDKEARMNEEDALGDGAGGNWIVSDVWSFTSNLNPWDAWGIAVSDWGDVYVTDTLNSCIWHLDATGRLLGKWGAAGQGKGQFTRPVGICTSMTGDVYVVEDSGSRLQRFTRDGTFVAVLGTQGPENGQFNLPSALATDDTGTLYVADAGNARIQVLSDDGASKAVWGGFDGIVEPGEFCAPTGIAVAKDGTVYVADTGNGRVQKLSSSGAPLDVWTINSKERSASLPKSLGIDRWGYVYLLNGADDTIMRLDSNGTNVKKIIELPAKMGVPQAMAVNQAGDVYVSCGDQVVIFKREPTPAEQHTEEQMNAEMSQTTVEDPSWQVVGKAQGNYSHITPDGTRLIGIDGADLIIWSLAERREIQRFRTKLDRRWFNNAVLAVTNTTILYKDHRKATWLCEMATGRSSEIARTLPRSLFPLGMSTVWGWLGPDRASLLITSGEKNVTSKWTDSGFTKWLSANTQMNNNALNCVNWNADGTEVVWVSAASPEINSAIWRWPIGGKPQQVKEFEGYEVTCNYVDWSPDGRLVHSESKRSDENVVQVMMEGRTRPLAVLDATQVFNIAFDSHNNRMAIAVSGRAQQRFSVPGPVPLRVMVVDLTSGEVVTVSPVGNQYDLIGWTPAGELVVRRWLDSWLAIVETVRVK